MFNHCNLQLEEGSRSLESPQQKLQRLQHEIRELGEEVHKIQVQNVVQRKLIVE